jgi:hypothetical protein
VKVPIADAVLTVNRVHLGDAGEACGIFIEVVTALPYYNAWEKAELAKYSPARVRESVIADADSVLVARAGTVMVGYSYHGSFRTRQDRYVRSH